MDEPLVHSEISVQPVFAYSIIGGCRAQNEPGHGGLSIYETFILWLIFDSLSHFLSWQQGLPGHSPGMPWPAATYVQHAYSTAIVAAGMCSTGLVIACDI